MSLVSFLAKRFVAGETAASGIAAARRLNERGLGCILDFLGEDVADAAGADHALQQYIELTEAIHASGVRSSISIKLSQMGLLLDDTLCLNHVATLLETSQKTDGFVWIDMEGSALTERTLRVFEGLRAKHSNVGICLQAYLRRTPADIRRLAARPVWIRLCKGAYKEPASVAFVRKDDVDAQYRSLIKELFASPGITPAFATHDETLLSAVLSYVREHKISRERFEFQMLYGIRNQRLEMLAKEGYRTQVYTPFGTHWLPYLLRRLRERRENLLFILKNLLKT